MTLFKAFLIATSCLRLFLCFHFPVFSGRIISTNRLAPALNAKTSQSRSSPSLAWTCSSHMPSRSPLTRYGQRRAHYRLTHVEPLAACGRSMVITNSGSILWRAAGFDSLTYSNVHFTPCNGGDFLCKTKLTPVLLTMGKLRVLL